MCCRIVKWFQEPFEVLAVLAPVSRSRRLTIELICREARRGERRVERVVRCKTSLVREMPLLISENNPLILECHAPILTSGIEFLHRQLTSPFEAVDGKRGFLD